MLCKKAFLCDVNFFVKLWGAFTPPIFFTKELCHFLRMMLAACIYS